MKHLHHQQMLLPPAHRQSIPPQPAPYVVHVAPPSSTKRSGSSSLEINLFGLIGLFCVFVFILYILAVSLGPQYILDGGEGESSPFELRSDRLRHGNRAGGGGAKSPQDAEEEATCFRSLEQERRARATLVEQLKQIELDLTEEKKKYRELEREYRDLALSSRTASQQQASKQQQPQQVAEDVSTLQRLAKCRQAVEESTQTIRNLREHSKSLDSQVTRLQKDLREAVEDADEQERLANECDKKLKRLASMPAGAYSSKREPPPPLPDDD